MDKIRIGVLGGYRGTSMINYCRAAEDAQVVAICDKSDEVLARQREALADDSITYYKSFDEFINHPMDAVVLANYANEHAPFAIRCLKKGLHVFSEVLPCQTMKEAVELIEAVEASGKVYAYGENYCYMPGPREMRRLYRAGEIGEIEYGEGEYVHNCESIWPSITYGERDHWRNNMYATFYCTHSLGPLVHITGKRPVKVVGFEGPMTTRGWRVGRKSGQFGREMVTMENGCIFKSIHGDLYKNSIWYTVYGGKGRMETAREDAEAGGVGRIYVNKDQADGAYGTAELTSYTPAEDPRMAAFGHGGSDFCTMFEFCRAIRGDADAEIIDVYEAMDMFLPGMFAYRSILAGGAPMDIPNLRDPAERARWRGDTACTDPAVAGDMLLPTFSRGNPDISDEVYARVAQQWEREKNGEYVKAVQNQGRKKEK
ncbi:MAG: Gfo/Idh/MocA family oxidoreductase [Clostridia bacterium]|nr:Gfo/Idh/MocA family oxidoreductase [Clostridia bacterium]